VALLVAAPAVADEGFFATGSYMHLGDAVSTLFAEEECAPSLQITTSSYGVAAGLGYEFHSGWTISGQWLHVRQDVDASVHPARGPALFYDGSTSKNGFVVTTTIPLRWFSPCSWDCR
jgi:hypothetical protein